MTQSRVLFLSGNQRSGKTLLQLMLASHSSIAISPGTNVIARALTSYSRRRPLNERELLELRRVLQKDRKFKAWRVDHLAYQAKLAAYRGVSTRQFVLDLMTFFRDQTKPGATIVGNKKGCYAKEADLAQRVLPEARFILTMRDPRDAVASMLATQPHHDLRSAALMWTTKARRTRELAATLGSTLAVCRYEELVSRPEAEIRRLCTFLSVDFEPAMLTDYTANDATRHHTDTTHPDTYGAISTVEIGSFRRSLTRDQVREIEGLCGDELETQGYTRVETSLGLRERTLHAALREAAYVRFRLAHETRKRVVG